VSAFGRTYKYNLNRDLETVDFQSGIDLGKRGLLSDNDILVFGALGGFIHSDLDYDAILWGNLTDDNQATLVSSGTTFKLEDDLQDVWGEVSAGVNFFNPSANTSVFAKVDVTFGDDLDGVGGKAGMRVSW
jgi:hypothetical protein